MSQRYLTLFNLLALAVISYVGVNLFYLTATAYLRGFDTPKTIIYLAPDVKEQGKPSKAFYQAIVDRNIFVTAEAEPEERSGEELEELEPTSLKIALLGTAVGGQQEGFAVIEEVGKRKQGLYRVGDSVQGATVKRILRGKVVLSVDEKDEILMMKEENASRGEPESPKEPSAEREATVMVKRSEVDESLKDVHQLLSQVRIRPHFTDGVADGLAVSNIKPDSIFARMGLRNGDIVQGLNGRNIQTPDDVMEVYQRLKSGSRVTVQVMRDGEEKIINYQIR
ncbi:MAG TPA: type II secretion system protein N [Desulfatiglandales bacterium]|nr:type II secretion system protein N [Desulfatiglandales bacterium]